MAKTRPSARRTQSHSSGIMGRIHVVSSQARKSRVKRVSWRDEQGGLSLTATPPLSDPAILAINPKFRYGKEELLQLREAPLSQRKPDFLDVNEVSPTIWDPTRWNADRKKSDTPIENGTRPGEIPDHRRRPGDPRERIRKENDGIVLSPQRRSFNSGCFVPVRETSRNTNNRPHSPLGGGGGGGKNEPPHIGGGGNVREIPPSTRRIGSGRIIRDPWDFGEKPENVDREEYNFRPQQRNNNNGENQERRSFGRDFEMDRRDGKEKDRDRRSGGGRFGGDRRRMDARDEEPEWFSGGPLSQNDTIELRGFDDSERLGKKKMSPSQAKRARDWFKKKSEVSSVTEEKEDVGVEGGPGGRSTPTPQAGESVENNHNGHKGGSQNNSQSDASGEGDSKKTQPQQPAEKRINDQSFNFDDILKSDTIPGLPGLLTNGVGGDGDTNGKSRFIKLFSVESNNMTESRRSSIQDNSIINNLLKDINETSVSIPGDSDSYFAPISPAANTGNNAGQAPNSKDINIMEMLQRGKQNEANMKSQVPGRIMNLVDLEAKMMHNSEPQIPKQHAQKSSEDMTAFNRLLAHISSNQTAPQNGPLSQKSQPMSLMEMLSHSQQQDEARMAQLLGPASPGASPHDLATRLQHAQSQSQQQKQVEMLTKLMNAGMQVRASPLPEMGAQQSRDLLNRPEAQAILQGLKVGDITPQHLYQQLANPALQPRHREMLVTILKLQGGGGVGPSPRVLSPVAPHPMFQQQQQQQLRVSPLPPTAIHQRIPSPRELQVHTQNILQRALIKKKLEEQQENYRKKQEMQQRGQSPNNNNNNNAQQPTKSVSSPTPLAFTPTSVLRKMTAEKDEGGKDVSKLVDGKLAQGRAVTGMRPQPAQQPPQQLAQQPQQQSQQSIGQWPFAMNMKQAGRPIVKANSFQPQPQQQQEQFFTQQQQQKFLSQLQQQQQRKQQQQQSQYHGHGNIPGGPGHISHPQYPNANQQFSQLTQQQLRAQHQQHARPTNVPQQQGQQGQQGHQQIGFGSQGGNASWQQFLNPQQQGRAGQVGRGGMSDGDLSPTSNQLTRWFTPDLLERARVGELPSTAGLSQHVLSLEEIERLTAPTVHN